MMPIAAPAWLTARPVAHRGLHDAAKAIFENTLAAAAAAIDRAYAIECDVQITADGEAVVFHDFTLDRLTLAHGRLDARPLQALAAIPLRGTPERIVTLPAFLALIGGRVPLVCEIKSRFDGDLRLAARVAEIAGSYTGPLALMSFDPAIIAWLRENRTRFGLGGTPLGMVAQASYDNGEADWAGLTAREKFALAQFLHFEATRPDFLAYAVRDLPHAVPYLCRAGLGLPLLTWTVRDTAQAEIAGRWADQIIFEGWRPP
jgi:glycerophosphoryl diester phosphodiesterase